jgi:hypothetical protein
MSTDDFDPDEVPATPAGVLPYLKEVAYLHELERIRCAAAAQAPAARIRIEKRPGKQAGVYDFGFARFCHVLVALGLLKEVPVEEATHVYNSRKTWTRKGFRAC